MIEVKDVKKVYKLSKDTYESALKGVSFSLNAGEFVAIYGPSGCGKSTLLNIIAGLDSIYAGDVSFQNISLKSFSNSQITAYRRDNIGFVFQNFNLIPHMSVFENVLTAADLINHPQKKQAVEDALEVVGLSEFKNKRPNQLSGGQRQRVAIARAIVNNPDVIIADEPTGALDTQTSAEVLTFLRKLADSGKLVIVVTHNDEVAEYGTRIIKMRDGLIESDSMVEQVSSEINLQMKNEKSAYNILKAMRFSFRNFMQRKGRNIFVALGTSIGIIGIILSLSLGNGVAKQVNDLVDNTGDRREITVAKLDPTTKATSSLGISETDIDKFINKIGKENVLYKEKNYSFGLTQLYFNNTNKTELGDVQVQSAGAVEYKSFSNSSDSFEFGNAQTSYDQKGIFLSKKTIEMLDNKTGDKTLDYQSYIGKEISIDIYVQKTQYEQPVKYTLTTKVLGIYKNKGLINLPNALTKSTIDEFFKTNNLTLQPASYDLLLKDAKLAEKVPNDFANSKEYFVYSAQQGLSIINTVISVIQSILGFVAGLSIIVAMVMIAIVLYISVIERTREIGTLKAIGYKNMHIMIIFLFEAALIAILANVVALVFAYLLSLGINSVIYSSTGLISAIMFNPITILSIFVFSIIAAMIAGLFPAIQAGKKDPALALRYE